MVQESRGKTYQNATSAGSLSEKSTDAPQAAIESDQNGNLFVLKETIDVNVYHKWLRQEQADDRDLDVQEYKESLPFWK